jgi:hypothetical protein
MSRNARNGPNGRWSFARDATATSAIPPPPARNPRRAELAPAEPAEDSPRNRSHFTSPNPCCAARRDAAPRAHRPAPQDRSPKAAQASSPSGESRARAAAQRTIRFGRKCSRSMPTAHEPRHEAAGAHESSKRTADEQRDRPASAPRVVDGGPRRGPARDRSTTTRDRAHGSRPRRDHHDRRGHAPARRRPATSTERDARQSENDAPLVDEHPEPVGDGSRRGLRSSWVHRVHRVVDELAGREPRVERWRLASIPAAWRCDHVKPAGSQADSLAPGERQRAAARGVGRRP